MAITRSQNKLYQMDVLPCEADRLNEQHELLLVSYFRTYPLGSSKAENK